MASYFPMVKNSAQRIVFPILDADGDPVTGAASDTPDSEYSLDGGSFVELADEIHEIATASGIYYLDLAADETNGDVVCIQIKTATAGTKTTVLVFYTSAQSLNAMDTNIDTLVTRLTATRAGYLDQLDFNLTEAIAAIPTTAMRGTDSAATETKQDIIGGIVTAIQAIADKLNSAMEADGAVHRFTENALEQAPAGGNGGAPTVEEIDTHLVEQHGEGSWLTGGGGWWMPESWSADDKQKALKLLDDIFTMLKKKLDTTAYEQGLIILTDGLNKLLQVVQTESNLSNEKIKMSISKLVDQMDEKVGKMSASKKDVATLKESLNSLLNRDDGHKELKQKILGIVSKLEELKESFKTGLKEIVAPVLSDEALERMADGEK